MSEIQDSGGERMAEEFGQAMATAEMPAEEAQEAAVQTAEAKAAPEPAADYDVDLDYNVEWEVETEPAEPDVLWNDPKDIYAGTPADTYYDEAPREAVRRWNKHLFVWVFNFVCGIYGVDRFVRGQIALGVFKCLTFGGLGIWYLVDLIIAMVKAYATDYADTEDMYFDILGRYV